MNANPHGGARQRRASRTMRPRCRPHPSRRDEGAAPQRGGSAAATRVRVLRREVRALAGNADHKSAAAGRFGRRPEVAQRPGGAYCRRARAGPHVKAACSLRCPLVVSGALCTIDCIGVARNGRATIGARCDIQATCPKENWIALAYQGRPPGSAGEAAEV